MNVNSAPASRSVVFHSGRVGRAERERLVGQQGCAVWLTGLSGSGKSTIARALEAALYAEGRLVYVLDGDNLRHGLNADLGFSDADRRENVRRTGEVAALFADAGIIAVAALISPFAADREQVRRTVGADRFVEVFLDVPLAVCEERDPKGMYRKARAGLMAEFTGISSPYEAPASPAVVLRTGEDGVDECVAAIRRELERRGILSQS
jgi:adenylylsulfate kinase